MWGRPALVVPGPNEALPGRDSVTRVAEHHVVTGAPMRGPWPGMRLATFGMGCFWGAERMLWRAPGVVCTAAGYAGGHTRNPTYHEVCSGRTGHTEVVEVVWDPSRTSYADLLGRFWEGHDPTQGMRQGNDVGTQYRSAIYTHDDEQTRLAAESRVGFQRRLAAAGFGVITTEVAAAGPFYFAEDDHQQYLSDAKNPGGYCGIGGTGVKCLVGTGA